MWDSEQLEHLRLQREHEERMRKAGEQLGAILDVSAEDMRRDVTARVFSGMREAHGLSDEDKEATS